MKAVLVSKDYQKMFVLQLEYFSTIQIPNSALLLIFFMFTFCDGNIMITLH